MKLKNVIYGLLILLAIGGSVKAQDANTPDGLFAAARKEAFDNKNYNAAIALAQKANQLNPAYTDITVFLGRLYAWKEMPDSARYYYNMALEQNPAMIDAYAAYGDLELWNNNYETSIDILNKGLSYDSAAVPLLLRKAKVLNAIREYKAAIDVLDILLMYDRKNTQARALASQIRDNVSRNRIGVKYDYVHFDKQFPDPWQFVSIDYTRQTKAGPVTARLNYGNRFKTSGVQYELEAYPRFSKTFYGYVNIGYSDDLTVFPRWRAGASLYTNLPKAFESEIGVRYLYFNSDAFIYTLYVGKYHNNFLFGARTYLAPASKNIAQSYSVLARYYYGGIDDYVGLTAGAGLSPDDRRVNVQLNSNYKLRTYTGELTVRHSIRKLNVVTLNISLLNQEYLPGMIGNQIQAGIGYIRRF